MFAPRLSVAGRHIPDGILCDMGLRVDAPEFTPGGTVPSPLKGAGCAGVEFVAAKSARSFPRQQGVARVQVEPLEVYTPSSGYYSGTDRCDDSDIPAHFCDYLDGPYRRPT